MKKSKRKELSEKTLVELQQHLKSVQTDIARLQLEKNSKRLKDVALIGKKRIEVARILTYISQKELSS
jgi:ribosomal protein L29